MVFGICGYGNLGKAVEKIILSKGNDSLFGIFSRRENVYSEYGTSVFSYRDAKKFKDEIDVMIMCGGSQEDLRWQSVEMIKYFNIIDTFDTHAEIENHKFNLESARLKSGKTGIYSCGWDPGLFSIARSLCASVFSSPPQTFWGKGVSQGHSEALRNIKGVLDAIQFTIPNKKALDKVKNNPSICFDDNKKHERHCYVCLTGERSFEEIEKEIKNTENYFKGQTVFVNETSFEEIQKLKAKMLHRGSVFGGNAETSINFNVEMENNPDFTANILIAYAHSIPKLLPGVYSVLEIPISLVGTQSNDKYL